MLKVSLLSEIPVFLRSRRLCLDSPLALSICFQTIFLTIAPFHQPFLKVVAVLIKLFIIRTNPAVSQSLTEGYTFLTVVRVTRCWAKKLMSVSFIGRSVSSCLFLSITLTSKNCICSFDDSTVNLIVGWQALRFQ